MRTVLRSRTVRWAWSRRVLSEGFQHKGRSMGTRHGPETGLKSSTQTARTSSPRTPLRALVGGSVAVTDYGGQDVLPACPKLGLSLVPKITEIPRSGEEKLWWRSPVRCEGVAGRSRAGHEGSEKMQVVACVLLLYHTFHVRQRAVSRGG